MLLCAECTKTCGTRVEASSKLDACTTFGNENGQLVCGIEYPDGYPDGTFRQSCKKCEVMDTDVLTCEECASADGSHKPSTLERVSDCAGVGNDNGQLVCEVSGNLPTGTFEGSCQGCKFDGAILECDCETGANMERKISTINVGTCKIIGNQAGQLFCDSPTDAHTDGGTHSEL